LKKVLELTSSQCRRLSVEAMRHATNEKVFGETLGLFPQRDRENSVPHQNPEESGFVLGMQKFSEVFTDLHDLEANFAQECEAFFNKINKFVLENLDKTNGNLKSKIKNFEATKIEYDKSLLKVQKIQKDPKKVSVVKLYEAEKERAKLFTAYDKAAYEMEAHCDDIDDLLNTKLLEDCVNFYNSQKNMLGLSYGQLDDIKEYLANLNEWCKEESKVCDEHHAEREAQREQLHKDETIFTKHQFALIFFRSLELIRVITQVVREKDVEPSTIIHSFFGFI